MSDLDALAASTSGKVEIDSLDDDRDSDVVERLVKASVLTVFRERCPMDELRPVVEAFDEGRIVHAGDDVSAGDYVRLLDEVPAMRSAVSALTEGDENPAAVASAVELVLEGLHLSKRLNKDAAGSRATYRSR